MNPRYFHELFGVRIGPLRGDRLRGGRLNRPYDCYELKSLGLDNRTTLVLSNTRELDRVPSTK